MPQSRLFAGSAEGEERFVTIENQLQCLTFSNKGGFLKQVELKDYKTYDSLPLIPFDPETHRYFANYISFFIYKGDISEIHTAD